VTWFELGFPCLASPIQVRSQSPMYSDPLIESSTETPRPWRSHSLAGLLLGTAVASLLVVAKISNQSPTANSLAVKCQPAYPPLNGTTRSQWASPYGNSKESLQFAPNSIVAKWSANGNYSWWAPEVIGRAQDHGVEVGYGRYLTGPFYTISKDEYEWTSHGFAAAHVPSANHTSCCCQFMRGSGEHFWITEYCRALVPNTPGLITEEALERSCAPYMSPACPSDNVTASRMAWPIPIYIEMYGKCYVADIQSEMIA